VPPLLPAQLQDHGPEPLTVDAVPVLQRPLAGTPGTPTPFALPHAPFTGVAANEAEHEAFVPPLLPAQDQLHGPEPLTVDAVPVLQRFVGTPLSVCPFEEPQAPLIATGGGVLPPAGVNVAYKDQIDVLDCSPFVLHAPGKPLPKDCAYHHDVVPELGFLTKARLLSLGK
jgi:hypothetical protein